MQILKSVTTKLGNVIELISTNLSTFQPFNHSTVLVIGVFHGDEPQGKFLIEEYLKYCSPSPQPSPQRGEGVCPSVSFSDLNLSPNRSERVFYHNHNYSDFAQIKSKELRKNSTDAEQKMWYLLRRNQILGLHFKRQKPIGKYVADFVCASKKLIIEIDGGQHNENENKIKDDERTKYFENLGYKVIRFWNNEVIENIEGVKEFLYNFLTSLIDSQSSLDKSLKREAETDSLAPLGRGLGRGANILFIPCLNPDGMALGTRTNANGVDLNRNFPTKNWGEDNTAKLDNSENSQAQQNDNSHSSSPLTLYSSNKSPYFGGEFAGSEIETQFVMEIIEEYKPEKILTLHAPYKVVNYDGPAKDWAESVSKIINYPVEESIGYPTPGSFGTYAGIERNIPVITLELDEEIPPEQLIPPVFEIFDNL